MVQHRMRRGLGKQAGAGMVEVLIALVISAFALLGLAGMQVNSMRYQKTANFRALATQYASEMSDRIRGNLAGARGDSSGSFYNFAAESYSSSPPPTPASNPCDGSNRPACTPSLAAARDLYAWRLSLNQGMTGGWGEVSGNVRDGFVIRVYFKEPNNDAAANDPNCRGAAIGAAGNKDVRCFVTVFYP